MSLSKCYFILNILLVFLSLILTILTLVPTKWKFSDQLRFSYALLIAVILIPIFSCFFGTMKFITSSSVAVLERVSNLANLPLNFVQRNTQSEVHSFFRVDLHLFISVFLCVGVCIVLWKTFQAAKTLNRIISSALLLKHYRTVKVLVSDSVEVPFSFWIPWCNFIVLPESIVCHRVNQSIAIAHEIQHHRQADTKFVYLIQLIKIFCFWNPFVYLLESALSSLQEFACDEAVAGHQRFSSFAYCRCLLWVAEKSMQSSIQVRGTLAMAKGTAKHVLQRRMELMLKPQNRNFKATYLASLGATCILGMFGVSFAASAKIRDRSLSLEQAQAMLLDVDGTKFPVVINDLVLEQLNRFLGTAEGRKFMRDSLVQMQNHKETVLAGLKNYQFPEELLAVPVIESGYRNLPQSETPAHGAGIWQFIPETARNFGMRVDIEKDERLDVVLETDAAMRLLGALQLQFQDWGLALLAYNGGAELVQKGIQETGSRDVWHLIREGYEGDATYMAKVMAVVLILKNPSALN